MAKKNHHPVSAEVENNPLYHDTYKLLRCYRDSTYSLMVAVRQVEIQFQLEYNTSVDEFLDSIYAAGADLGDSQIEEWAKSIARSNKRKEMNTMMKENVFTGCTIVATGKLAHFTRDEINSKIIELGAKAGSSVTKKTNYLICGEKAGSKLTKAQALGIKILSEDEFLEMIA